MTITGKKVFLIVCVVCLIMPALALAEQQCSTHPELGSRMQEIRTVGLLSPALQIYELSAGGVREMRDDWSVLGRDNVAGAITRMLKDKNMDIKPLSPEKDMEEEIQDIQSMYRAVSVTIWRHVYHVPFPEKQKNFDYTLGSMEGLMERLGVDALVMVDGRDEISTGGRKALMAAGALMGALTGVVAIPRGGVTVADMALVDKSGAILWFNGNSGAYDLRDPDNASQFVAGMLTGFPETKK